MALGKSSIDQIRLSSTPDEGVVVREQLPTNVENRPFQGYPTPNGDASMASFGIPVYYGAINPEIAKSYVIHPTNQGQRGAIVARQSLMIEPRNNPSRSQFNEGYTLPIQQYSAVLTWDTPSGQHTAGKHLNQPSTKLASPFGTAVPIRTRMPWDL